MDIKDLQLYQECLVVEEKIWSIVISWDYFSRDTVGKQLVRSADSISSNIAEGFGRYFYKENKQFCFYSRGSIEETKGWLYKAKSRNLITEKQHQELIQTLERIHKRLNAYIKSIGQTQ